jgi:hypothetical protein
MIASFGNHPHNDKLDPDGCLVQMPSSSKPRTLEK